MLHQIKPFLRKPSLFEPGTTGLWTDDHISKGMLEAHLHPSQDAATRNHEFVKASVEWLSSVLPPPQYPALLDLGCGPGIYAEQFCNKGYTVTGVDISRRSIEYAVQQAQKKQLSISYRLESYLDMDCENEFDIATLIFCDFGVLSRVCRRILLKNVRRALKPQGCFVFDVFTPVKYEGRTQSRTWEYFDTGFFKPIPYISLNTFYRYDEDNTYLTQNIIADGKTVECFNIWEHTFTIDELEIELSNAGFLDIQFLGDIAGTLYTATSDTICVVAR